MNDTNKLYPPEFLQALLLDLALNYSAEEHREVMEVFGVLESEMDHQI